MRIVYVGDNRNRGNFGCRGTSTALSQLIGSQHEIVGRISGKYTNFDTGDLYCIKGKKEKFYKRKATHTYWEYERILLHYFHRFVMRGGKFLFGKYDFVSLDFDAAINELINCLPANPKLKEFDLRQYDFDALVVNGEGSFIFSRPAWRESLIEAMEMHWAHKLGKKVYYLNGMLSDDPNYPHNQETVDAMQRIFKECEAVCVREYHSLEYAKNYFPDIEPRVFPDALFTWYDLVNDNHRVVDGKYYIAHSAESDEAYTEFDFSTPYVCVSGSSAIMSACKGDRESAIIAYCNLVNEVKKQMACQVYLIQVDEGDEFLNDVSKRTAIPIIPMETPLVAAAKILANARVYISGRYHPAIMASLGGTPCVFMSSNSHKTLSIQELLQYEKIEEYNLVPDEEECKQIVAAAKVLIQDSSIRNKIKERASELSVMAKELLAVIK